MKTLRLLTLAGITSIALAHAGWAAGHGGGGGFGGGGFGGGHIGGGGFRSGGGFGGFNPGAPMFGGTRGFSGVGTRGGGIGFGTGRYSAFQSRPSSSVRSAANGRSVNPYVRATTRNRPAAPAIAPTHAATVASATGSRANPNQRALNGRTDHIYARHDQNWHNDWDHRRAHFSGNHWWVFDGGAWIGLDDGFFPWDYYPYYAFDYYPYDYYPGYYSDVEPYYNNEGVSYSDVPAPDTTVSAVQARLTQLGYYNGPADGIFGPLTRDAVARYQTDQNLAVTGSLSGDTLQSLGMPGMASN
jgi:hypothetical protein